MTTISKRIAAAMAAFLTTASFAQAQEVTLRIAHPYADNHYLSEHGIKIWAEDVMRRTDGAVAFEYFPAGQLGKAQVSLLETGLADISFLVPSQEVDKMPLSSVLELPGYIQSACAGADRFNAIARPGGELDRQELAPLGVRLLYTNMLPPYVIMTKANPVRSPEDMVGLKLRANGVAIGETMRGLEAVPLPISSAEIFESISRGTIDGAFFPWAAITPYSLEEEIRYITQGVSLGGAASLVSISEESWQGLSPEIQTAMLKASEVAQENLCTWLDDNVAATRAKMTGDFGIELIDLSPEDAAAWYEKVAGVADNWVARMGTLGLDGAAVIAAFDAAGGT
ncbi:TRAP transporter substrate-binding protein DctP [Antarctobacter sp.]|uniref:TRAP transporter substrate-binding protein n=1 Tax=Antarctobacter sp. TaxID=1872577 RepID=UPI003A8F038C